MTDERTRQIEDYILAHKSKFGGEMPQLRAAANDLGMRESEVGGDPAWMDHAKGGCLERHHYDILKLLNDCPIPLSRLSVAAGKSRSAVRIVLRYMQRLGLADEEKEGSWFSTYAGQNALIEHGVMVFLDGTAEDKAADRLQALMAENEELKQKLLEAEIRLEAFLKS